jgi:hypothetical protein
LLVLLEISWSCASCFCSYFITIISVIFFCFFFVLHPTLAQRHWVMSTMLICLLQQMAVKLSNTKYTNSASSNITAWCLYCCTKVFLRFPLCTVLLQGCNEDNGKAGNINTVLSRRSYSIVLKDRLL